MSSTQPPNDEGADSIRDALTGVYNHQHFSETLTREIARAYRYKLPLTMVMADIDDLKRINDASGHPTGDKLIKAVAAILQSTSRVSDFVFRIGGDEFVLLLTCTSLQDALRFKERLRTRFERLQKSDEWRDLAISVSVGLEEYKAIESAESFIARADQALRRAKHCGGDNSAVRARA